MGFEAQAFQPTESTLQAIWQAAGLGAITDIAQPERGSVNACLIVNDEQVIRFDTSGREADRFASEVVAYRRLAASRVPVPEVVLYDDSRRIVPVDYLITTRLPGVPVIDCWPELPETTRQSLAREAGQYLAWIHEERFDHIGKLRYHTGGGFPCWTDYVEDYFRRYAQRALAQSVLSPALIVRMKTVLEKHRPLLDAIAEGRLVHSDYHFENILQQRGRVTGIIDFEWAFSGDPSADMHIEFRWQEMCPGSGPFLLAGYTAERPLDAGHEARRRLYELLLHLETIAAWVDPQDPQQTVPAQEQLLAALRWLEG